MIRMPGEEGSSARSAEKLSRAERRRLRRLRTIAIFPTLFTLGNLFCGFFSIVVAARVERPMTPDLPTTPQVSAASSANTDDKTPDTKAAEANATATKRLQERVPGLRIFDPSVPTHNVMLSGWLIFLAMIFDALDGHVARLARSSSEFGAQLDSLCDLVTFGVAPAFLLVKMCPQFTYWHPDVIWIIAALYAACAALRLARFNVETDENDDHMHFSGLPSPAAAASIAGFAILFYTLRRETATGEFYSTIDWTVQWLLPVYALLVGALMVSRIPYPHIVNQMFRGQRSFGHLVGVLFALVAVMVIRGYAVPILCCAFVLTPPAIYFWKRLREKRSEPEPLF